MGAPKLGQVGDKHTNQSLSPSEYFTRNMILGFGTEATMRKCGIVTSSLFDKENPNVLSLRSLWRQLPTVSLIPGAGAEEIKGLVSAKTAYVDKEGIIYPPTPQDGDLDLDAESSTEVPVDQSESSDNVIYNDLDSAQQTEKDAGTGSDAVSASEAHVVNTDSSDTGVNEDQVGPTVTGSDANSDTGVPIVHTESSNTEVDKDSGILSGVQNMIKSVLESNKPTDQTENSQNQMEVTQQGTDSVIVSGHTDTTLEESIHSEEAIVDSMVNSSNSSQGYFSWTSGLGNKITNQITNIPGVNSTLEYAQENQDWLIVTGSVIGVATAVNILASKRIRNGTVRTVTSLAVGVGLTWAAGNYGMKNELDFAKTADIAVRYLSVHSMLGTALPLIGRVMEHSLDAMTWCARPLAYTAPKKTKVN